ncbi:pyruvate dehydrogenase (acetyl-transferring) E1 component subunit alpha [Geomonas sp. RF6]|uniref:pyruvate dehydrogenase (acetyl-transferring) E1 component subunit alpha n=1 Tax=Geomonas sp. RF6 TaxID=2897342 RepID=UPI001E4C310C|nr:pyruvate dehydrogenase (acetyl-transferring) E1 component subunit alpha [Geomonas sp. RF6]UFS70905.1 pyruvate dehydrogenase (acetyl-transferring) E1 component subunit alpha [Geomonas sp. RF6]
MSEEVLATFDVKHLSVLDVEGNLDRTQIAPPDDALVRRMYECMVLSRVFDERALSLQREGRLGTYPSILGQEAAQVGSAIALEQPDWVFPAFRESGVHLTLGYPVDQLFQYWGGDERGMRIPDNMNIFPVCVAVGTHIPHAVGAALAAKYRKDPIVVVAYFGDGATSKGDFHEGLNMAGVLQLPVVFICQNNQWAISIPVKGQTAAATIAQKAIGYGFDGIQVDGNDVFAVHHAAQRAFEKARSGGGPTFIECLTYRLSDHTTADDAGRYRRADEVEAWRVKDPLLRLERYMAKEDLLTDEYRAEVRNRAVQTVDDAVRVMEEHPPPAVEDLFTHTLAQLTPRQARQLKEVTHGPA